MQGGGHRPHVLLVEDSADNRFMMRRLLELNGYDVLEAVNGVEAIRLAEEMLPDLILMDLNLPIMDGPTATRRIREVEALKEIPIVVVTACDTPECHREAFASGCNEYVTKPIDVGLLEDLIKSLVEPKSH